MWSDKRGPTAYVCTYVCVYKEAHIVDGLHDAEHMCYHFTVQKMHTVVLCIELTLTCVCSCEVPGVAYRPLVHLVQQYLSSPFP